MPQLDAPDRVVSPHRIVTPDRSACAELVVETRGLSKDYGAFGALHELDLEVPAGSVFALLGASGAGKTTTIKLLLNLIRPSAGRAWVLGADTRHLGPEALSRLGYVSESQVLPVRLKVSQFFDYLRPLYAGWDRELELELRAQLELPAARRIGELSHGMRMKMALACALPPRPSLLVLDEPLSGLDALARDDIIRGFRHRAEGMSVLLSSHELDEVERFATHVAFLHGGRLLFQGSVAALAEFARPLLERDGAAGEGTSSGVGASGEGRASGRTDRGSLRRIFVALVRAERERAQ